MAYNGGIGGGGHSAEDAVFAAVFAQSGAATLSIKAVLRAYRASKDSGHLSDDEVTALAVRYAGGLARAVEFDGRNC